MFDIGIWELSLILIVALLVVGPERLPALARKAGSYYSKARRMVSSVRDEVERELRTEDLRQMLNEQQEQIRSLKQIVNETRSDVENDSQYLVKSLDEDIRELVEPKKSQSPEAPEDSRDDERSTEGR
jgi:sec-independent protein translocase protein TatB